MGHDIEPPIWRGVVHDLEHAAHAVAISAGLFVAGWLGVRAGLEWTRFLVGEWSFFLGSTVAGGVQETYDAWRTGWRWRLDGVKDFGSWQLGWLPWLLLTAQFGPALALAVSGAALLYTYHKRGT